MSVNKYSDHLLVLPEDDANRQVINGFLLHSELKGRAIQVLPICGGWSHVLDNFLTEYVPTMYHYPRRHIALVVDFDNHFPQRLQQFQNAIPAPLHDRVFVIGTLSEPEGLRQSRGQNFEEIGWNLSKDCFDGTNATWSDPLLAHNTGELLRLIAKVRPFLF